MTLTGNPSTGTEWEWRKGTSYAAATAISGYAFSSDPLKKVYSKTFATGDEGNYYFVAKDAGSCQGYATIVVSLNPTLTITPALKSADVCLKSSSQTSSLAYSATGSPTDYTITWDAAGITAGLVNVPSTALPSGSPLNITVPANTGAGTYTGTIIVTKTGGCPSSGNTFTLTVNPVPAPTFTAAPAAAICVGGSATYTTQAGQANYVWTVPGVAGTDYTITAGGTGTASNTVTLTWNTSGSKTVTVNYSGNGCPGATAATSTLTVNPPASPTFINPPAAAICVGGSATYTTQAGQTNYIWTVPGVAGTDHTITGGGTGTTSNTVTLTWNTAGSKTVTVNYSSNGCPGTTAASNTVTINASATPTFTTAPITAVCVNGSATYTTQAGQTNYVWTVPGVAGTDYTITAGGTGAGSSTVTLIWKTAGSKTVTVNYSSNGCPGATAASTTTTVNNISSPNISCGTSTNSTVEFNWPALAGATGYTISHTKNGGASVNDPATASGTYTIGSLNPGDNVTITVLPTGGAGTCFSSATFTCTATSCAPLPAHPATPDIVKCNNANVTYSYTANPGGTITWTNSSTAIGLGASGTGTGNTLNLNFTGTNTGSADIVGKIRVITTYGTCNYPDSFNITINPGAVVTLTSAAATAAQTVCVNKAINNITYSVTATGNNATVSGLPAGITGTYNAGVLTISGTPTQGGTFNYTVTATGTCTNGTATGSVNVTALPVISSVTPSNPTTCGGSNGGFTINGLTPSTSYTINFIADGIAQAPQILTSTGSGSITIGSLKQGGYTGITATIAGGCASAAASTTLSDPSVFTPVASSNEPCAGFALNLASTTSSDPSAVYTWTGPGGYTATGATQTILSPTTAMSGTYNVKTTVAGCSSSGSVTVTVNPVPAAPTAVSTPICGSGAVTFTGTLSGASTDVIKWYSDAALTALVHTGANFTTPALNTNTSYYITETTAKSCVSTTATKVDAVVNTVPTAGFTSVVDCKTNSVTFTNTSGPLATEWTWNFDDGSGVHVYTNGNQVVWPYPSGGSHNVTLSVKTAAGCGSTTPFAQTISFGNKPRAAFTATDFCLADKQVTLVNSSTIGDNSLMEYIWEMGDGSEPDTIRPAAAPVAKVYTYANGGDYKVLLTAISGGGCFDTVSHKISIVTIPAAHDSIVNHNSLCSNLPVKVINLSAIASPGTISKVDVFWDANNLGIKTTDIAPAPGNAYTHLYPEFGSPLTKTYVIAVRAYNVNGCYTDSVQTITLNASPKITFSSSPIPGICQEKDTIQLTQASDSWHLPPDIGYYSGDGIVPGTNSFVPKDVSPGNHIITYSDTSAMGCADSKTTTIFVYATPTIKMDPVRSLLEGDHITLNPRVTGNIQSYLWSPDTYLSSSSIINPVAKPADDITYKLKVTTKDGCEADSSVLVKVLNDFVVPNTFTPNNDGINDYWVIEELPNFPIQKVQVFNRYGQVVYESKKYNPHGWDGNYKGKPLPFGTYYYIIELNGMVEPKVGYVTIVK